VHWAETPAEESASPARTPTPEGGAVNEPTVRELEGAKPPLLDPGPTALTTRHHHRTIAPPYVPGAQTPQGRAQRREWRPGRVDSQAPLGIGTTRKQGPSADGEADNEPTVEELEGTVPPLLDPGPTASPTDIDLDNEALIPQELLCSLEQLEQRIGVLFPESCDRGRFQRAIALVGRAYRRDHYQHNMAAAIEAVGEFHFDAEALQRDQHEFDDARGDLELMVARRIASRRASRMNPARIEQCISADNPQRAQLLEFATTGVDAYKILPAEFQPNGDDRARWPRQTPDYKKASSVVNSLLSKTFHAKGLAIILPASQLRGVHGCNVSTSGWAPKSGEKSNGRPTFNPRALNLERTKLNADEAWGVVRHPRAATIVAMILRFAREWIPKGYTWADFRLWTIDIDGAYTLEDNAPRACKLLMTELTDSQLRETVLFIYTCGSFGTNYQPAAFDVITRAARHELIRLLEGLVDAYVDDFYGIVLAFLLDKELDTVKQFFRGLLGEKAVSDGKSATGLPGDKRSGTRVEIIGWAFDLIAQHVTLSASCLEKSLHGFMSINEFEPMPIKVLQRLASWGIRYGTICPLMNPFTSALYNELRGRTNMHCKVTLNPVSRMAVHMLRTLTLLMGVDEPNFARPFVSWEVPKSYTGLIAQFDGSLAGSGMLFLARGADQVEHPVGLAALDLLCLGFGEDSGYQNTAEYISQTGASRGACVLRDRGLLVDGEPITGVWLRGDSDTALKWGVKGRVKSTLALNACLVNVIQSVKCNMPVLGEEYIPAALNKDPDGMSRLHEKGITLEQWRAEHPRLHSVPILDLHMSLIVPLCNPANRIDSAQAFESFWARARAAFE
jgi:hypothetical protein